MHRSGITSVYGPDAPPGPNMISNVSEMVAPNVSHIYIHVVLLTRAAEFVYRSQSILSAQAHQPAGDKICETGAGRRAQASRRR